MKFVLTMNMPSHKGNPVHQIICEHPSQTLEALRKHITENDYITVKEYYYDNEQMKEAGEIVVNCMYIGKVKTTKF